MILNNGKNSLGKEFVSFAKSENVNSGLIDRYGKALMSSPALTVNTPKAINSPMNLTPYILEERALNVTQMDVYSRMMADRIIFFNQDVRDDNMGIICAQMLFLENIDPDAPIKMFINSPGGSVIAGLSLYDTIMSISPRVETTIMGIGASMGSILGTVRKLHSSDDKSTKTRFMLKHSRLMIHDIRGGGGQGTYTEQRISLNLSGELRTELFTILSNHSGKTVNEIEELCQNDKWYKAEEALANNFIDEVIGYKGE